MRDGALLLIGFSGALRRSELVGLDVDDISEDHDGLRLVLQRFKTDQEGETKTLACPTAPTRQRARCGPGEHGRSWQAWRPVPAFRAITRDGRIAATRLGDRAVAQMIRRRALAAGLDGHFAGALAIRGLRHRGHAQGAPELAVMRHGRWRSATVMRGYVEEGGLWKDNAAARLGL